MRNALLSWSRLRRGLTAATLGLGVLAAAAAATFAAPAGPGMVHPDLWPSAHSPAAMSDPETEAKIDAFMAQMSVEEKVGQVIQADITAIKPDDLRRYPLGSVLAGGNSGPNGDDRASPQAWLEMIRAFHAVAMEPRPGHTPIPVMFGLDAVHGDNNIPGATIFPHNIGLGAARDPALVREIGNATAEETAVIGADWAFGPTLAVPQDVRWGRSYEGYAEEPEVVRDYASAMVEGLQGPMPAKGALASGRVAASVKHFLADGGTEGGKDQGDAKISEDELIRIHAQGYPAAIDAGVLTVMASFSSWNGVKNTGNRGLLTEVLKGRMGFEGFVVGDWNAHGQVPGCTPVSCAAAFNAGLDMFMAPDGWKALYANTLAEVKSGEIPMARLDDAVRRILRVKIKAGLFATERPFEGRFDRLGAPDHRALARRAVRESLVLLKNNGALLPLRADAHVLVAGDGADDIGRQSGGWTISWQGADNTNADFPHGQSIWSGLHDAVTAAGGTAELRADGSFTTRPDVAIVVFGEKPYAEFQGDIPTVEYQPGDKRDLALLRRLKAQHIPVVAVFLSGRPLWTNPEINASDAFVAAWLPGTEGGGVADVLLRKPDGSVNRDFRGKLSYSWPKTAASVKPLHRGDRGYDPQFAYGYGLSYRDHREVGPLSETSGASTTGGDRNLLFRGGRAPAPWSFMLSGAVSAHPVDAGAQESGKAVSWTGEGDLRISGPPVDLTRQTNAQMALQITYRIDRAAAAPVKLQLACSDKTCASLDVSGLFARAQTGAWSTVAIRLACFGAAPADLSQVTAPFMISTHGPFGLSFAEVSIVPDTGKAVCP